MAKKWSFKDTKKSHLFDPIEFEFPDRTITVERINQDALDRAVDVAREAERFEAENALAIENGDAPPHEAPSMSVTLRKQFLIVAGMEANEDLDEFLQTLDLRVLNDMVTFLLEAAIPKSKKAPGK